MTRIVLATQSSAFEQRFREATNGAFLPLPADPLPTDPNAFLAGLNGAPLPDIAVLDATTDPTSGLQLANGLRQRVPGVAVLLVSRAPQEIGLAAMRAGVLDILDPDADGEAIRLVLDRASLAGHSAPAVAPVNPEPVANGRVIPVISPKGGVGKTTVSTNLAVGLATAVPGSTVIVDLDVQFGDVSTALNLVPDFSLLDTVRGPASRDTMALKTFLSLHKTGLYAICAPESPAAADTITGDEIGRLIQMLATQFRYVVIDTAPGLSEHTLAALDQSTDLVMVTSMDVPGVRGLRKEIDILQELDLGIPGRQIVLNHCDPRGGLSVSDVNVTIGTTVDLQLPVSPAALPAMNQGIPLLQAGGRDPIVQELRKLVEHFAPEVAPAGGRHARRRSLMGAGAR